MYTKMNTLRLISPLKTDANAAYLRNGSIQTFGRAQENSRDYQGIARSTDSELLQARLEQFRHLLRQMRQLLHRLLHLQASSSTIPQELDVRDCHS